jgi:hypothetical protein
MARSGRNRSAGGGLSDHWVRRSVRASGLSAVQSREVQELVAMIKSNHPETVVFKVKHYISSDVNCYVMDAVLNALMENTVCESLYIQNFNEGMLDDQFDLLSKVLKKGNIWCLNIGEIYKVSPTCWTRFAKSLADTNVTHM